jgi:hypothetical protein
MKQICNLANICARRNDGVLFQVCNGIITVHVGHGPDKERLSAEWNDDETINKIIYELNFGKFSKKAG